MVVKAPKKSKKIYLHSTTPVVQMSVSSVYQREDGIIHIHLFLVSEWQGVKSMIDMGSEELQQRLFQGLHDLGH